MSFSIRSKILLIVTSTVIFSLALTSSAIYILVRLDSQKSIHQNLESLTTANALAVSEWGAAKATAVAAIAAELEPGDPRMLVKSLMKSGEFSVVAAGWKDKSYTSTTPDLPKDFDPTTRLWYQESLRNQVSQITKPYRSATGVILVSFTSPIMREGRAEGALGGGVSLDKVSKVVASIHPTPSSIGFVVIVTGSSLPILMKSSFSNLLARWCRR